MGGSLLMWAWTATSGRFGSQFYIQYMAISDISLRNQFLVSSLFKILNLKIIIFFKLQNLNRTDSLWTRLFLSLAMWICIISLALWIYIIGSNSTNLVFLVKDYLLCHWLKNPIFPLGKKGLSSCET